MSDNINKQILKRLEHLERAVFPLGKKTLTTPKTVGNFKGTKGGTLFLISKGYFNKKRTAREVMTELEKNDYHYRIQVVQTTLNRLSSPKGPLTALDMDGHKIYVKRK